MQRDFITRKFNSIIRMLNVFGPGPANGTYSVVGKLFDGEGSLTEATKNAS